MNKMEAVVLHAPGDYTVQQVEVPVPGVGEVLVKIKAVAICGSDPRIFSGGSRVNGWPPYYPFIAGHEFAGEVVALGAGATKLQVGDRVAGEAHCGCGFCEMCMSGLYNLCLNYRKPELGHRHYGHYTQGCYAQYQVYSIKALTVLPSKLTFAEGAMVDTAGIAYNALRLTGVVPGGYTAIVGPGPIGLLAMQIAKIMGSRTIMVGRGQRLQMSGEFGADYCIDFEKTNNVVEAVREITGGAGVHQVVEASGSANVFMETIQMARKGGQVAFLTIPADDGQNVAVKSMVMNQISVHGVRANPNCSPTVIRLMEQGKLNVKQMVTHVFGIDDIKEAFDVFVNRKDGVMKVIIDPWKEE